MFTNHRQAFELVLACFYNSYFCERVFCQNNTEFINITILIIVITYIQVCNYSNAITKERNEKLNAVILAEMFMPMEEEDGIVPNTLKSYLSALQWPK